VTTILFVDGKNCGFKISERLAQSLSRFHVCGALAIIFLLFLPR
jgi:hypothetical protein